MSAQAKPKGTVLVSTGHFVTKSAIAVRLTDPNVSAQLSAELKAMRDRPALARQFLLELGVITPKTGKLTKRFGG